MKVIHTELKVNLPNHEYTKVGIKPGLSIADALRYEIFIFFSSRSLKTREKYINFAQLVLLSLYIFLSFCVNERRKKPKYFAP